MEEDLLKLGCVANNEYKEASKSCRDVEVQPYTAAVIFRMFQVYSHPLISSLN